MQTSNLCTIKTKFQHFVPVYLVQKNGEKIEKNEICAIYPGNKCEIKGTESK